MDDAYACIIGFWGPIAIGLALLYSYEFPIISGMFTATALVWLAAVFWIQSKLVICPNCREEILQYSDPCPKCKIGLIWRHKHKHSNKKRKNSWF
jgi:hypothetical protein